MLAFGCVVYLFYVYITNIKIKNNMEYFPSIWASFYCDFSCMTGLMWPGFCTLLAAAKLVSLDEFLFCFTTIHGFLAALLDIVQRKINYGKEIGMVFVAS